MHDTPYPIAQTQPGSGVADRPPSKLPMHLLVTALLCCAGGQVARLLIMWLTLAPDLMEGYLHNPWQIVGFWISALAADGCGALLLTRVYLQRHRLVTVTRPERLIALFVGLYVVAAVLGSVLLNLLWAPLVPWIYQGDHGIPPGLLMAPLDLAVFALTVLLPLWLSLHLMRRTAQVETGLGPVGRGEAALAFGALFSALYMALLALLPTYLGDLYAMQWLQALSNMSGLGYGAIALLAARSMLPRQLPQLAVGRLAASVLVCLGIWLVIAAGLCFVLLVALYAGSEFAVLVLLVVFGLLLLALLWPLTRMSLRWVYRPASA